MPPQPSEITWPQVCWVQEPGEQQVLLPERQTWLPVHEPQLSVPPQPSEMFPQAFAGQVPRVQQLVPTQVWLLPQVGQVSVWPQPSPMEPHWAPALAQLVGVQQAPEVQ